MSETYEFWFQLTVRGEMTGYSKRHVHDTVREGMYWMMETFSDSLPGRVRVPSKGHIIVAEKMIPAVPKAPEPEQVILPDNRMWLP